MLVMKPLLLFSATLLAIFAPIEQTNVTLERISIDGILRKIHEFNLKLINDVLLDLGHDPNSMVNSYLPKLAFQFMNETLHRVGHCYDSSVGDNEVDIFHQPIGNIIASFFKTYSLNEFENLQEIKKRIKTLLHNIIHLAKEVAICALNTDPDYQPTKLGLTQFASLSHEEFLQRYASNYANDEARYNDLMNDEFQDEELPEGLLGASGEESTTPKPKYRPSCINPNKTLNRKKIPSKFDWRDRGVVSPVQDQKGCNGCFIFAAIGAMESAYMIKNNGSKVKFNEQAYVNCIPDGCDGGFPPAVMLWAIKNGLTLTKDGDKYSEKVLECKQTPIFESRPSDICAKFNMSQDIELEYIISHYGPAAMAIDVSNPNIMLLKNGPWNAPCKETLEKGHAVLAVGYNESYWFIKNSWGSDNWGVDGYLLLPKNNTNKCAIYTSAYVPKFGSKLNQNHTIILNNYLSNLTYFEDLYEKKKN